MSGTWGSREPDHSYRVVQLVYTYNIPTLRFFTRYIYKCSGSQYFASRSSVRFSQNICVCVCILSLVPNWWQAIVWINDDLFSILPLGTDLRYKRTRILIEENALKKQNVQSFCSSFNAVTPGGTLGQVSYGGCSSEGPHPYPILGKAGLQKHTLFYGNLTIPGTRSGPYSKNIPYFRENFIIPGTRSGPDSENIPYFREIW